MFMKKEQISIPLLIFIFMFFSCKKTTVSPDILTPPSDSIEARNIVVSMQLRISDPPGLGYDALANELVPFRTLEDAKRIDIAFEGGGFHAGSHFVFQSSTMIYDNTTTFVKVNGEINYDNPVTKKQVKDLFIKKQATADQFQNQVVGDVYIGKIREQDVYILFKITKVRLDLSASEMTFDCKVWR